MFNFLAALAASLLLAGFASAQSPRALESASAPRDHLNQQARDLSKKMGRQINAEALEIIIEQSNQDLLEWYKRGLAEALNERGGGNAEYRRVLPAEIESLLVKFFHHQELGVPLRRFYAYGSARYQSRALFDLLYAEGKDGAPRPPQDEWASALASTDQPGIEADLLALLKDRAFAKRNGGELVLRTLAERHYQPAATLAGEILNAKTTTDESSYRMAQLVIQIGGADAHAVILRRLTWLREQAPGGQAENEMSSIVGQISRSKETPAWTYAEVRRALPATLTTGMTRDLVEMLKRSKDAGAIDELLAILADPAGYPYVFDYLADSTTPQVWAATWMEVERLHGLGKVDEQRYQYAKNKLTPKIENPQAVADERQRGEQQQQYNTRMNEWNAATAALEPFAKSDPQKYLAAYESQLDKLAAMQAEFADMFMSASIAPSLDMHYFNLAGFARFKLKQPAKAAQLYERGVHPGRVSFSAVGLVDTWQFDLNDPKRALDILRKLQPPALSPSETNGGNADTSIANWYRFWVDAQIDYLSKGKRFGGEVGVQQFESCAMAGFFGLSLMSNHDFLDTEPLMARVASSVQDAPAPAALRALNAEVSRKLASMPTSAFSLLSTSWAISALPDADAILRYVNRHDPGGFQGACLFAIAREFSKQGKNSSGHYAAGLQSLVFAPDATRDDPNSMLNIAAKKFMKERGIVVKLRDDPPG